jgi:peptidyl-prolyl cis-trans isomerase D
MQIIQNIRDKGAAIVIAVITLSLIGFILMDAQQGGSQLFGALSSNAGEVNGKGVEINEFNEKVREAELIEEQRSGQKPDGARLYQIRDQVWNQLIAERIFDEEATKLGINRFTARELESVLISSDQINPLAQEQSLIDPATGKLDPTKVDKVIKDLDQREMLDQQIINPITLNTKVSRYSSMISGSAYYPTWMQKRDQSASKSFATISYVNIPYTEIQDNSIKVSDEEIGTYINKNKDLYKQEAGRTISYYSFELTPLKEDSLAALEAIQQLVGEFQADTNNAAFVARYGSTIEFQDKYIPKVQAASPYLDTIVTKPVGSVFGPYYDASRNSYVIAKYLGSKSVPDSVKARHILIVTNDMQSGQQVRDDASAKKLADSLLEAVKAGSDFATLAMQFSSDGSKEKGGDLGTFGFGTMVSEFNDFCFYKQTGERGVVKTQFGYHVIEINSQKDTKPAYKVAYVNREIFASEETVNKANLAATKLSANKDAKSLAAYAKKNNIKNPSTPPLIKESDYMVSGIEDARTLVRWVFEAKQGDVSDPITLGNQVIVAIVEKILKEGVQDVATARAVVEPLIRKDKKTEMIINKLGNNPTLESAAAAYNKPVQQAGLDSSLVFSSPIINGIGMEAKVAGAAFNKSFLGKTTPAFGGTNGVYVIKVNSIGQKPADSPELIQQQFNQKLGSIKAQINNWYEGLKKLADIEDNRSNVY